MIDVCYNDEPKRRAQPLDRGTLIGELEANGLRFERVDRPRASATCLVFAAADSDLVTALTPEQRRRVVLVVEGGQLTAVEADAMRDSLGILGLIEPSAWSNWKRGLLVAWGLFGRADVAREAGLVLLGTQGLQPSEERAALPVVLARFLACASRVGFGAGGPDPDRG